VDDHLWIEHRNQAFEVARAQGGDKGIDHPSLLVKVGFG
jgi:hypothetical protein